MAYISQQSSVTPVPVRIGLIGSGWMGAFHAESVARRVPGAALAAIADPNTESAQSLALQLGTAKVTASAEDIFADPEIDAVVIASPARFHSPLIAQAAAAGKHIFCEKPAGQSLAELDAALGLWSKRPCTSKSDSTGGTPMTSGQRRKTSPPEQPEPRNSCAR